MDVLLAIFGSEGDVRPNVALGQGLQARGHTVRVCASPDSRRLVEGAGLPFEPVGGDVRGLMAANARYYIDRPYRAAGPMTRTLKCELVRQFRELPRLVGRPDLVIGSGLMLAGPSVAEAIGRPYHHAMFTPVILRSRAHGPVCFPFQSRLPLVNRLLWLLAGVGLELSLRGLMNRERRRLGLAPIPNVYAHLANRLLLAADRELAPLPADVDRSCPQTGYWHLAPQGALTPRLEQFLDRGPFPVYIGFGSMGDPDPARTAAAVQRGIQMAGVRAVVHHGGAGTVMTAARAGVPQVLAPHLLDQYYWARRIQRLALGPRPLARRRLDARALADALQAVVADDGFRRRAAALAAPLRARDGIHEALSLLPRLVDS